MYPKVAVRHATNALLDAYYQEYITPQSVQRLIQLCVGSWSSGIGSSDVMRTLHTSARPVSRQGTIVFDPRGPATPRVPLRCVRYYDAKIRFRSTKTLHRAGSGVAHSGGLCTLAITTLDIGTAPAESGWLAGVCFCGAFGPPSFAIYMEQFIFRGTVRQVYFHTFTTGYCTS